MSKPTHYDFRSSAITPMDTSNKENIFLGMGSPFKLKLGMEQDQLHFDYNYTYPDQDSRLERREASLSPFDYSRDRYRFREDSVIHNPDFVTSPLSALAKRPREDNDEGEPDIGTLKSPFKSPSRRRRGPLFSPPSRIRASPLTPFDSINSPRRSLKTSPYGWRAASEVSSFGLASRSPFDIGAALDFPLDQENMRWGSESPVLRTSGSASSGGSSEGTIASQQEQLAPVRDGEMDASGSDDSEYLASTRILVAPGTPPTVLNKEEEVFDVGSPLTPVPERRQIARKTRRVTWAGEAELQIPISTRVRARAKTVGDISSAAAAASSSSSPFDGQDDDDEEPGQEMGFRALPPGTEVKDGFWRWYREFPVIKNGGRTGGGAVGNVPSVAVGVSKSVVKSPGTRVQAMSAKDLYTPRWVKGRGVGKMGMCPVCGEEGKTRWFAMKFSAYNYHMQYSHGISAASFRPLDPPLKVRVGKPESSKVAVSASKAGQSSSPSSSSHSQSRWNIGQHLRPESEKLYGLCGRCEDWVPVEGVKDVVMKVPEMVWWKHIRGCQGKEKRKGMRK